MKLIHNIAIAALALTATLTLPSCSSDFLDPEVVEYATAEQLEEVTKQGNAAALSGVLMSAYNAMITYQERHDAFGEMSVGLAGDLMTEDMVLSTYTHFIFDYEIDNRAAAYARPNNTWSYYYQVVVICDSVIAKIPADAASASVKGVLGEALALRAFAFHNLIQRFQHTYVGHEDAPGIPLMLPVNDDRPSVLGRGTVRAVYDKILTDYDSAVAYLKNAPSRESKMRIDYQVAAGLFARALLTVGDYARAAQYASIAKDGYPLLSSAEVVKDGFNNIGGKEWMWGCDITGETSTSFASFFSHVCSYDAGYGESTFAAKLIDAKLYGQITATDSRRGWFKDPSLSVVKPPQPEPAEKTEAETEAFAPKYCNFKFRKVVGWQADYLYMRASEMYLIEAEALARQGKEAEAYNVLKVLMDNRDPQWSVSRTTVDADEIFLQKRLELWGEGRIFYDYLRLKKGVDRTYTGTNHYSSGIVSRMPEDKLFIYQLPQREIDNNPEISEADQNE